MSDLTAIENPELTAIIEIADSASRQAMSLREAVDTMLAKQKTEAGVQQCANGLVACCCAVKRRLLEILKKLCECHDFLCAHWQFPRATHLLLDGLATLHETFSVILERLNNPKAEHFKAKAQEIREMDSKFDRYFIQFLLEGLFPNSQLREAS